MNIYITIDGGTTNTRVNLVKDLKITDTVKISAGARAGIDNKNLLKTEIKKALETILKSNNLSEEEICCILASGMITSEFGLCCLEHICTPAGIDELASSVYETVFEDITKIPFMFIRGVKSLSESFEDTDIMRGEETEIMGIMDSSYGECIYILPGSHSKIINTDKNGRIVKFSTMLTGEMIASLSQHTILKSAVDLSCDKINEGYLLRGYDYCRDNGINKALFKTRILKNVFGATDEEVYSFFLGVILCGEIVQIICDSAKTVVIGGKAQIKDAMKTILEKRDNKKILVLDSETVDYSTSLGAIKIYENRK